MEQACETALTYGASRLKSIRNLLKRPASQKQQSLPFIEEHPIIRPLSDYSVESLNAFRKERDHERDFLIAQRFAANNVVTLFRTSGSSNNVPTAP